MKSLLLLRHAKSSWKNSNLDDYDRPLNKRGKSDAPRVGKLLREQGLLPDLIITSSARRARRTAELVIESSRFNRELRINPLLYHADPETILAVLRQAPADSTIVLVVGHNPGLEELLNDLIAGGEDAELMPTACLARVDLPLASWADLHKGVKGELAFIRRPRED